MRLYYLLFIVIIGLSCAAQQETAVVEEESEEVVTESVIKGLEPLSMLKDDVEVPAPEFEIKEIDYKDILPSELKKLDSVNISIDEEAPGFRVQIGFFQKIDFAIEIQEEARNKFEEEVYLDFAAPYNRVRVGDCLTRNDANMLLQKVRRAGYRDAFVTPSRVYKYPELRKEKREEERSKADSLRIESN